MPRTPSPSQAARLRAVTEGRVEYDVDHPGIARRRPQGYVVPAHDAPVDPGWRASVELTPEGRAALDRA